jgi:hypothetical protein
MLPKFRPATLNASDRPKIRPVKPSAPPPPPRRHSSGIRNQDLEQPATQNYGEPPTMAAARARIHEIARELPAENRFPEPHHARHNFNDETQGRIDGADYAAAHEAYDRQFGAPGHGGADAYDQLPSLDHHEHFENQDPMTELRPAYDEALQRHEHVYREEPQQFRSDRPLPEDDSSGEYARRERRSPPPPATYSAASNSFDPVAYEANYPKASRRDEPSYADRREKISSAPRNRDREEFPRESSYRDEPRRDEGRSFRREERREERREPRESSYQPPARADETRAEGSSAKHEKRGESSYRNEPAIPAPANVPRELRVPENFVVGVQPLRTPSMGAPQAVIAPAYPAMTAAASPGAMNMNMPMSPMTGGPSLGQMGMPVIPQISMPPMMAPMGAMGGMPGSMMNQMHVRAHTSARPGHIPQPTEVEEAQQGSKVGRFAWFVFGAAFGIFFAFAATGFGFGKKDDAAGNFPPPPATLTPVQTAPTAPAPPPPVQPQPVVQQAPPPVAALPGAPQQPVTMQQPTAIMQPPMQQPLAPVSQSPAPPPGVMVAPGQQLAPIVPAAGGPQQAQGQQPTAKNQGTVVVRGGGGRAAPAPRRGGGGGARPAPQNNNNDDDAPAPAPKKSGGSEPNVADLLGDGLGK